MFLLRYFKYSFQYKTIFSKLEKFNIKVFIYFILIVFLSAFPLNYEIIQEDGFQVNFIAQTFENSIPSVSLNCEISSAGMTCEEEGFIFRHEGIDYYYLDNINDQDIYTKAIIFTKDAIYYQNSDLQRLESDHYSGFSDRMSLSALTFMEESDKQEMWIDFGTRIEHSFSDYFISFSLITNTMVQFAAQALFVLLIALVLQFFKYQLSTFMTFSQSITFVVWMMTVPALISIVITLIEPVFATVIYQFLVGIIIMIVMLKYGRKYYQ
jgi:hypothetical protein